ncbi:MAG: sortase [Dehalococcoidia bacterium]|jgi:sortase A
MKTQKPQPRQSSARSNAIAAAFVLGAAAVAWFGLTGGAPAPHQASPSVTVAKAAAPGPANLRSLSASGLPTRIVVPSAAVDAPIAEVGVTVSDGKATWETAWKAAGHHIDSALPGQPGNMVITGHVSVADRSNLAVFKQLDKVAEGDTVEVYSGDQIYRYSVSKVMVVPPSAVKLLRSSSESTVTLVTCTRDLKNRLVVVGTLQG